MTKSVLEKYADYTRELFGMQKRHPITNMGINPKKCKSCKHFKGCQSALNKKPMDNACREYEPKKRR